VEAYLFNTQKSRDASAADTLIWRRDRSSILLNIDKRDKGHQVGGTLDRMVHAVRVWWGKLGVPGEGRSLGSFPQTYYSSNGLELRRYFLLSQTCLDCLIIEHCLAHFLTNSKKSVINRVRVSTRGIVAQCPSVGLCDEYPRVSFPGDLRNDGPNATMDASISIS
jgi:hypothetical protein